MDACVIFVRVTFNNGNLAICVIRQRTVVTWIISTDIGNRHCVMSCRLTN